MTRSSGLVLPPRPHGRLLLFFSPPLRVLFRSSRSQQESKAARRATVHAPGRRQRLVALPRWLGGPGDAAACLSLTAAPAEGKGELLARARNDSLCSQPLNAVSSRRLHHRGRPRRQPASRRRPRSLPGASLPLARRRSRLKPHRVARRFAARSTAPSWQAWTRRRQSWTTRSSGSA